MLEKITQGINIEKEAEKIALQLGFVADKYYSAHDKMIFFGTKDKMPAIKVW